jgi:hypothetical protein
MTDLVIDELSSAALAQAVAGNPQLAGLELQGLTSEKRYFRDDTLR